MAITVGDIYKQFPGFRSEDMIRLMNGRTDFNGRDTVPLRNIASYQGMFSKELSVFTAEREGKDFLSQVSDSKREEIAQTPGISSELANAGPTDSQQKNTGYIPMGVSVFNIAKQNKNYG